MGCSRYHQGHAFEHYRDTHHCYAMQLGNNRVWDYVGDNFVHRLLQDKDGKMVEGGRIAAKSEGAAVEEKVDSVQLEFTYLLTSQLETQRQYFEEKLNRSEQRSVAEITELRDKLGEILEENSQFKVDIKRNDRINIDFMSFFFVASSFYPLASFFSLFFHILLFTFPFSFSCFPLLCHC